MCDPNSMREYIHPKQACVTLYHAQLGLPDRGCAIKWLSVYNSYDLNKEEDLCFL